MERREGTEKYKKKMKTAVKPVTFKVNDQDRLVLMSSHQLVPTAHRAKANKFQLQAHSAK